MHGSDPKIQEQMTGIGCVYHPYNHKIFKDKVVVSFCNGNFLKSLPVIVDQGRPKATIWFNCMTWTFPKEVQAQRLGWLDFHGFVSEYQKSFLLPQLESQSGTKIQTFEGYRPHFHIFPRMFNPRTPSKEFVLGRISRADPAKFSADMWKIFQDVKVPGKEKKVTIMAWSDDVAKKVGPVPDGIQASLLKPNQISSLDFYHQLHCMIHKTGGSRESYCRVLVEAYAHGVPAIVEDAYAFPELVVHGETGFRCKTSEEMSHYASLLAENEAFRKRIIYSAYEHLKRNISGDSTIEPWLALLKKIG